MTTAPETSSSTRRIPIVDATAPPERLAIFRILLGGFTLLYLGIRLPVFLQLADRSPEEFAGVGLFAVRSEPLGSAWPGLLLTLAFSSGIAATLGYRYRLSAPIFAVAVLLLTTYRSSWGQLLHFENLFTLHLLILAFSPAADRLSIDHARSGARTRHATAYGFPLALAALVVVVTYVLAGIAKLRAGGLEWITGDTLLHHVAYSAARLELLGGTPSPFARTAASAPDLLPWMAGVAVVIELGAPLALLHPRARNLWVGAAWAMHAGTLALMFITFPYPLFLVAFAPFFELERLAGRYIDSY